MNDPTRTVLTSIAGYCARINVYESKEASAPSVLALHGFTGSGEDFLPLREALNPREAHWICPDFMGHGGSQSPEVIDPYNLPMAMAVIDRARALAPDPDKVLLLAYSMGGRLALHYLRWAQPLPAMLIGSSPGLDGSLERATRRQEDAKWVDLLKAGIEGFCAEWEKQPLIRPQTQLPEPLRAALAHRRRQNNPVGLFHSLMGCGTGALPSLWPVLAQLPPIALLHGTEDTKFAEINRLMLARNNGFRSIGIPQTGHAPHLEAPEATAVPLRELLISHFRN